MIIKPVILVIHLIMYNTVLEFSSLPMSMTQCELNKPDVVKILDDAGAVLLNMECKQ